jgi:hypothetical protein
MKTLATVVAFASGFALMGHHQAPAGVLATSLAVDASLAPLTAVIAARHGRGAARWAFLGFVFGMWALAAALLLARAGRQAPPSPTEQFPPTSDAA